MKVVRCLSQASSDTFPYSSGDSIWARFVASVRTCFRAARSVRSKIRQKGMDLRQAEEHQKPKLDHASNGLEVQSDEEQRRSGQG